MKLRTVVLTAVVIAAVASLPPVRRGVARLILTTTGTVVRDQKRVR